MVVRHHRGVAPSGAAFTSACVPTMRHLADCQSLRRLASDAARAFELARMMVSTPEPAANGRMKRVSLSPCAWRCRWRAAQYRLRPSSSAATYAAQRLDAGVTPFVGYCLRRMNCHALRLLPVVARGGTGVAAVPVSGNRLDFD